MRIFNPILLLFVFSFITGHVHSQSILFADQSYYLIDSLNLDELSDQDSILLEDALSIYHNTNEEKSQIKALEILFHVCRIKYNDIIYLETKSLINEGEPIYKLLLNALLAGLIFPLHAFFERALKKRLVK